MYASFYFVSKTQAMDDGIHLFTLLMSTWDRSARVENVNVCFSFIVLTCPLFVHFISLHVFFLNCLLLFLLLLLLETCDDDDEQQRRRRQPSYPFAVSSSSSHRTPALVPTSATPSSLNLVSQIGT